MEDCPMRFDAPVAVARWPAAEVALLVSLLLLIACVAVWGSILG